MRGNPNESYELGVGKKRKPYWWLETDYMVRGCGSREEVRGGTLVGGYAHLMILG